MVVGRLNTGENEGGGGRLDTGKHGGWGWGVNTGKHGGWEGGGSVLTNTSTNIGGRH